MLRQGLTNLYESFLRNTFGPLTRQLGQSLYRSGVNLQRDISSDDRFVQDLTRVAHEGQVPQFTNDNFVAPNSVLVGSVNVGDNASVWYGTVVRGPVNLGRNSVVQDNCVVSGSQLGNNVFVGPNSVLVRCFLDNNAFVGMGSSIRDGATVKGVVAAGSTVEENQVVGEGQIWAGSPAQYLRDVTPEELNLLREHKQEICDLAQIHQEENSKSFRQVIDDQDLRVRDETQTIYDMAFETISKLNMPIEEDDEEFLEQRVFMDDNRVLNEIDENSFDQDPYEHDLENYPYNFKQYKEDYGIYERAQKYFEENPVGVASPVNQPLNQQNVHSQTETWNQRI